MVLLGSIFELFQQRYPSHRHSGAAGGGTRNPGTTAFFDLGARKLAGSYLFGPDYARAFDRTVTRLAVGSLGESCRLMLMPSIAEPSAKSLLLVMQFNGAQLATGTGFLAQSSKGPVLITNRHNLTGRHQESGQPLSSTGGIPNEVVIVQNVNGQLGTWMPIVEPLLDPQGLPRWREHPVLGARADFVALPLTSIANVAIYPYDPAIPGADISVGPADVLSVVGFPFGIAAGGAFAVWATGFMASEPAVDFNNLPTFLIDCRSRPGQSGSAVIAYRNGGMIAMADGSSAAFSGPVTRFLGIYSGRINDQSDIGIVWKAGALAQLLQAM